VKLNTQCEKRKRDVKIKILSLQIQLIKRLKSTVSLKQPNNEIFVCLIHAILSFQRDGDAEDYSN